MCLEYSGAIAKYLFHFHPENHQFFAHELSQSNVALLSYSSISRKSSSTPTPHIYYAGTFQWQSSCSFSGQNIFMQISNNVCMPLCLCATQLFEKSSKSFQLKYTMYVIWYEWILFIHLNVDVLFVRWVKNYLCMYYVCRRSICRMEINSERMFAALVEEAVILFSAGAVTMEPNNRASYSDFFKCN